MIKQTLQSFKGVKEPQFQHISLTLLEAYLQLSLDIKRRTEESVLTLKELHTSSLSICKYMLNIILWGLGEHFCKAINK